MDVYSEIQRLNEVPENRTKIKKYLISCCEKYRKYRSSKNFMAGMAAARNYVNDKISWKEFHKYEYELEGEAFSVEFYQRRVSYFVFHPDKPMLADLKKIRIEKRLPHKQAIIYLEALTDFVVYVLSYCYRAPGDLPPEEYKIFLCQILFKRYFRNDYYKA